MTLLRLSATAVLVLAACLLSAAAAKADLRLCNRTDSLIGVSIGYKTEAGWKTEGWWNIEANACEALLAGALSSRYYYVYAIDYDRGGEWGGEAYMCTHDKEFTIEGVNDCMARGFQRTGFFEIDTGNQVSWTVQLTDEADRGEAGRGEADQDVGGR